ncbi:hypothetical protein GWI33_021571 [Rhynchophorus ferrugineus]|uniref:Uncharacterized protein n=1 Tax=Rhynchophorus ferrugineus TaxID=354439 RepID=A0A834IP78_RHYFE|nr:hypothetical protein GWI33_021571 [Rhynchophorus ferrugineus]
MRPLLSNDRTRSRTAPGSEGPTPGVVSMTTAPMLTSGRWLADAAAANVGTGRESAVPVNFTFLQRASGRGTSTRVCRKKPERRNRSGIERSEKLNDVRRCLNDEKDD